MSAETINHQIIKFPETPSSNNLQEYESPEDQASIIAALAAAALENALAAAYGENRRGAQVIPGTE